MLNTPLPAISDLEDDFLPQKLPPVIDAHVHCQSSCMKTPWSFLKYILTLPLTSVKSLAGIILDNSGMETSITH
jgi:hypothetical protein